MANINMTYQDLHSQAQRLESGRGDISGILDQLMSQVNSLISSGFVTDQASGAFGESYQKFTVGAKTMIDGLQGMTSFLNNTATAMSELDTQLATAIRS